MGNTTDSPELIDEIGGSFALGQWLADHDPSFKNGWSTWCSEIRSVQGVADDASVVLEAVLDVVREDEIEQEDRKLVFKYVGPGTVSPLKISVAGNDLLEQTYAMLTAASSDDPAIVSPEETELETTDLPEMESGVDELPSMIEASSVTDATSIPDASSSPDEPTIPDPLSIPDAQSVVAIPPVVPPPTSDFIRPLPLAEDAAVIPELPTSGTHLPSPVEAEIVLLPKATQPAVAEVAITKPSTSAETLPLPAAAATEIVIPPEAAEPVVAVADISESKTLATPVRLPEDEAEIVALTEAAQSADAVELVPDTPTSSTLPSAAEAEITTLPEADKPADPAVVIPEPPTPAPPTPEATKLITAGQYLLPIAPFPSGESVGKTLAQLIEDLGAELPQAASDVLGHLKVRELFLVLSRQFKGLVLEVELHQPIRALVRLSMAKEKDLWTFGGEVIVARESKNETPRAPLVFILKFAAGKKSKSLVMALNGEVDLVDDLFRPMFGDQVSIPDGISLKVMNPALVFVKENSKTKALLAVSLQANVDFGDLPFVGEGIKAQGTAKLNLGIQYASGPFQPAEIDELNSVLGGGLQLTTLDGAAFDGLQLAVALQMTGKPLLLNVPLSADKAKDKEETPGPPRDDQSLVKPTKPINPDKIQWIKVNRSVGPAYLDKVGVGFDEGAVQFRVSASVQMSGLTFFVEGLGGGLKLVWPPEAPTFNLDGLGIGFEVPPISISGALLRTKISGVDSYDGMAVIKAANFTITGLGSYSTVGGDPSLFIFAVLHKDLGGPSFFHVTGLAAGFGYNRALKLPPIEEVQNFPLVRAALEENYFNPGGSAKPQQLIQGAMEKLRDYIPASGGEYWFAAGIRFNSFEMIQSFALLSISFGHEVQIGLLGLSRMSVPKGAAPGSAIAYAELALRAVIKPEEGSLAVEGRLTDNSYIFSRDCRLTGGFAFYTWFSGTHSGDFVITLGGYHPKFIRPAHYPIVPRLGVNWQVSSQLRVTAEMYFALTPSCLMAGGRMSAVYDAGAIKAWFVAYADFLLSWQPFFYTIDMGITIGVEVDLFLFSISVHLSVDLHIWGPAFAGQIDVDLSVVSFTVRFGPDKAPPAPLKAGEFVTAFLPPAKPPVVVRQNKALRSFAKMTEAKPPKPEVVTTQINSGLLRQETGADKAPLRVVNGHALTLSTQSMIPVTSFGGLAAKDGQASIKSLDRLGVRPMGKTKLTSEFSVNIRNILDSSVTPAERENLRITTIENGVPEALWGKSQMDGVVPAAAAEAKTITVTLGITIAFAPVHPRGALPAMEIEKFAYETFNKPIPWDPSLKPATIFSADEIRGESLKTVMSNKTTSRRNAVLDVLARQSPFALNKVDLAEFVKKSDSYFQADPMLARVGSLNESIA